MKTVFEIIELYGFKRVFFIQWPVREANRKLGNKQ